MDIILFLCAAVCIICMCLRSLRLASGSRLPPGPRGFPVFGNMFQLGSQARSHQGLAKLAAKYGPLMTLRLGCMRTVVVSSSGAAREMFKVNDLSLAGRTVYEAMKVDVAQSNNGSIITAQYGPSWRLLRRLCSREFFTSGQLNAMKTIRNNCMEDMVRFIREESEHGKKDVEVAKFVFFMNFNLLGNLMFSRNLVDPKSKEGNEFYALAAKIMEVVAEPNLADFLPLLKPFDLQRIRKKMHYYTEKAFEITAGFTRARIQASKSKEEREKGKKDFLDVLLNFKDGNGDELSSFSSESINALALEMFIAGTDTTTSVVEWALAELLHNPQIMNKLLDELSGVAGPDRGIEEADLESLPYLRAVVKETLRLHPPLPLMVPHRAMESCTMMGYEIPKHTQVLVNTWAIGRDPETWEDPHCFKPERFLDSAIEYKGQHFEYLPFGSGRRMCPGMPLAHRLLPLTVAALLLSFDWVLPEGVDPSTVDMREKLGITLRRATPLRAIPLPRRS
ncbi:iridoid oxidase-like [Nymphaea colorata]|nr:iridoid oxidase-like [Nymphaea colorata]